MESEEEKNLCDAQKSKSQNEGRMLKEIILKMQSSKQNILTNIITLVVQI